MFQDIRSGATYSHKIDITTGQSTILWDFCANGDIEFAIYAINGEKKLIYPRYRLFAGKIPEEGMIENLRPGLYEFEFHNSSNYFDLKLDYCILSSP